MRSPVSCASKAPKPSPWPRQRDDGLRAYGRFPRYDGHAGRLARELEFVVPLCFIAVLVPLLRDRVSILVFAVAAIAAIVLDAMPLRLSMICGGLLAIGAGVLADEVTSRAARRKTR